MMNAAPYRNNSPLNGVRVRRGRGAEIQNFFSLGQVAAYLGVSTRTVRRWIRSGDLASHRFRAVVRVGEADLRAYLAAHRSAET
jgi:excisionase family DNA binding protein